MSNRKVAQCSIWGDKHLEEFILWARCASWMSVAIDKSHGYEILRLWKIGTNTNVIYYRRLDGTITSAFIGRQLAEQFNEEKQAVTNLKW